MQFLLSNYMYMKVESFPHITKAMTVEQYLCRRCQMPLDPTPPHTLGPATIARHRQQAPGALPTSPIAHLDSLDLPLGPILVTR